MSNPSEKSSPAAFQSAIEALPDELKASYLAALERCPILVQTESAPQLFLAASHFNVPVAAARLSQWWKIRSNLFDQNTYRPMIASSSAGALSKDDLEVLESGFFVQLPVDNHGRIVLFYNREQLSNDFDDLEDLVPNMNRCAFYMMTAAAQQQPSAPSILLVNFCSSRYTPSPVDHKFLQGLSGMLGAGPVAFNGMELLVKPPRSNRDDYLTNILPAATTTVKNCFGPSLISLTVGNTNIQMMEALQIKGLRVEGIPTVVGGE